MIGMELLAIAAASLGVSTLLLGVGYGLGRQSMWPTVPSSTPWRAPREGGYRGQGDMAPATPPAGASATSRGAAGRGPRDHLDGIRAAAQACIEDRPSDPNAVELATRVLALLDADQSAGGVPCDGVADYSEGTGGKVNGGHC